MGAEMLPLWVFGVVFAAVLLGAGLLGLLFDAHRHRTSEPLLTADPRRAGVLMRFYLYIHGAER